MAYYLLLIELLRSSNLADRDDGSLLLKIESNGGKRMKSRKNLAIVLLLTILIVVAFASPALADSWVTGKIKDQNLAPLQGANVTATNGTLVYWSMTNANGDYKINITSAGFDKTYNLNASLGGYTGAAGATFYVNPLDRQSYGPFDILMTKDHIPKSKIDTLSPATIPADGYSKMVVTAKIYDNDTIPLAGGTVNATTIATVNFYLRNGASLNISATNGTLAIEPGYLGSQPDQWTILNVPIDANGEAKVRVVAGTNSGQLQLFNNVTVKNIYGNEVNATKPIIIDPLIGYMTGVVRYTGGSPVVNANLTAERYVQVNVSNLSTGVVLSDSYRYEPVTNPTGGILSTKTNINGVYTLSIPVLFNTTRYNITGTNTREEWKYNSSVCCIMLGSNIENYLRVTATDMTNQTGVIENYIAPLRTSWATDIVIPIGEPNAIKVTVEDNYDLAEHNAGQPVPRNPTGEQNVPVKAQLLQNANPFPGQGYTVTLVIDNPVYAKFSNGLTSITVSTDNAGTALASINIESPLLPGRFTVTGTSANSVFGFSDKDVKDVYVVGEISGQVVNTTNAPLPGAAVALYYFDWGNLTKGNLVTDQPTMIGPNPTNASIPAGQYQFSNLQSGSYYVEATFNSVSGHATAPTNVTTGTTTANVVVVVAAPTTGSIAGKITNVSSGNAIASASIYLNAETTARTSTDSSGNYTLTNIATGHYIVKAVASNYVNATKSVDVFVDARTTADIALTPVGSGVPGDTNGSGKVSDTELLAYISAWSTSGGTNPTDTQLLAAIANWAQYGGQD